MNHSTNPNVRPMVCNHYGCRRVVFYTLCPVSKVRLTAYKKMRLRFECCFPYVCPEPVLAK